MDDFNEKEMSDFILNQIDEYAKIVTPMVFIKVEDENIVGILEERKYNVWFHRICLNNYLNKKFYEKLNDKNIPFFRFLSKFENEHKDIIQSLCQHLATQSLSLASKSDDNPTDNK